MSEHEQQAAVAQREQDMTDSMDETLTDPEPTPARPASRARKTSDTGGELGGKIRPTKKQRELLSYIDVFIKEHGYSPSYREIMNGLHYTSVATVALHVNNLITRGHLRKRDRSARSLEVVEVTDEVEALAAIAAAPVTETQEKWLVDKVNAYISELEGADAIEPAKIDDIYVLVGALHVLGLDDAVRAFVPRIEDLKA